MDNGLEIARTKVTLRYLAEHAELSDAEKLLHSLKETSMFLERRISREKSIHVNKESVLKSEVAV